MSVTLKNRKAFLWYTRAQQNHTHIVQTALSRYRLLLVLHLHAYSSPEQCLTLKEGTPCLYSNEDTLFLFSYHTSNVRWVKPHDWSHCCHLLHHKKCLFQYQFRIMLNIITKCNIIIQLLIQFNFFTIGSSALSLTSSKVYSFVISPFSNTVTSRS